MADEKLKQKAKEYAYARRKCLHLSQRDTNLIQLAYLHGLETLKAENEKIFNDWLEACTKYGEVNLKLTKAQEIITALLNTFVYDLADDEIDSGQNDVKIKAEQFLKEVTK